MSQNKSKVEKHCSRGLIQFEHGKVIWMLKVQANKRDRILAHNYAEWLSSLIVLPATRQIVDFFFENHKYIK